MATEQETILIDIKVNDESTRQSLVEVTQALENNKKKRQELRKEISKSKTITADQAKQLTLLNQQIKQQTQEQANYSKAVNTTNNSLGAMRRQLEANKAALRDINQGTKAGRAEFIRMSKETDALNKKILAQEKGYGVATRNVGNYEDALNSAQTVLPSFASGLAATAQQALRLGKALLATPWGIIIAGIAAIASAVSTWTTRTQEGREAWSNFTTGIDSDTDVLLDRFAELGGSIVDIFSAKSLEDFKKGLNDILDLTKDIQDEQEKERRLNQQINKQNIAIEKQRTDFIIKQAVLRKQIAELRLRSREAEENNAPLEERVRLLTEAREKEIESIDIQQKIEKEALRLQLINKTNLDFQSNRVDAEIRLNNILSGRSKLQIEDLGLATSTEEDRRELAEQIAQFVELETKSAKRRNTLQAELNTLLNKSKSEQQKVLNLYLKEETAKFIAAQKEAERVEKQAREDLKRQQESIKNAEKAREERLKIRDQETKDLFDLGLQQKEIELQNTTDLAEQEKLRTEIEIGRYNKLLATEQLTDTQKEIAKIEHEQRLTEIKEDAANKRLEIERQIRDQELAVISSFLGATANLFQKNTTEYKTLATAQALIDTYAAASKAYASQLIIGDPSSPIRAQIAAAAAVAAGLGNVAKINEVTFEDGGFVKGPSHKDGGIQMFQKHTGAHLGEFEGDEYIFSAKRTREIGVGTLDAINFGGMTPKFQDGGSVTRGARTIDSNIAQTSNIVNDIMNNMPEIVVSAREVVDTANRVAVKESLGV